MRLLLVNPLSSPRSQGIHYNENLYLPLGLLMVGSALENAGHKVKIIDMKLPEYNYTDSIKSILEDVQIVGITGLTPEHLSILKISELVKEYDTSIQVIAGGVHASLLGENMLQKSENLDIVVKGEGEETCVDLLHCLERGEDLRNVKGIVYRERNSKNIIVTEERPYIRNLDMLPFPAYHLIPIRKYFDYLEKSLNFPFTFMLETSRGCPFNCIFCSANKLQGRIWRAKSAEKIVDDIKKIINTYSDYRSKITGRYNIRFSDLSFTINRERVMEFCELVMKEKLDISWWCEARPSDLTKELVEKMAKSGCFSVAMGGEAGYDEGLRKIQKQITTRIIENSTKMCLDNGIKPEVSFIIGFPWEKLENLWSTVDFAIHLFEMGSDVHIFKAMPYPKTRLLEIIEEQGYKLKANFQDLHITGVSVKGLPYEHPYLNDEEVENAIAYFKDKTERSEKLESPFEIEL